MGTLPTLLEASPGHDQLDQPSASQVPGCREPLNLCRNTDRSREFKR